MRPDPTSTGPVLVQERGIALIAALMIMLLMSALMIGFTAVVMSDQRYRGIDKDRTRAFYGAQSGLEKLSADMGNLFDTFLSPTPAQITALGNNPPVIPDITYVAPAGVTAYGVAPTPCLSPPQVPVALFTCTTSIQSGNYNGLIALKQMYILDAVARTTNGGEVHLTRKIEAVKIPVFQFGMFSDVDLSFFAGPNFNFGGRVHTNGNLFLAQGGGAALTLTDKVTAVGEVVRQRMQNGVLISSSPTHDGTISMATAPNAFRNLLATEGSVIDGIVGPPQTVASLNTNWKTVSLSYYNGYIRNGGKDEIPLTGGTGAKKLNLPLITVGGANTDLTRRPQKDEDTTNSVLFGERMFGKVSLRILLSDRPTNITNLPGVTATAPIPLGETVLNPVVDWKATIPAGLTAVGPANPPIARSPGLIPATFKTNANTNGTGDTNLVYTGAFPAAPGYQLHVPTWPMAIGGNSVTCNSVTMTQFLGCVPAANWVSAATTSLAAVTINGVTYSPTLSAAIVGVGNKTAKDLTIVSGANPGPYTGAGPWALNTFWVLATDNANYANYPTLVTCTGVDTANSRFTGCSGSPNGNYLPKTALGSPISTNSLSAQNTGLIGGYIKIEIQLPPPAPPALPIWQDVTAEILNYGIAGPSQNAGGTCPTVNPKAIIRLQRLKDAAGIACTVGGSLDSYDYWPNVLFDAREGLLRDIDPGTGQVAMGGLMHFIELDVSNLKKWFSCAAPYNVGVCSGNQAYSNSGYGVYFSDRRNNVNPGPYPVLSPANVDAANLETGEYGFEDFVNPGNANGQPNDVLDGGEDLNANNTLDKYGEFPSSVNAAGVAVANSLPAGGINKYNPANISAATINANSIRPWNFLNPAEGMVNRTYLFRRALKLINGSLGNIPMPGLTVITENPVYIQGDWNANQASTTANFGDPHAATSVIADAVTLLGNEWNDIESFLNPYNPGNFNGGNRTRTTQAWYRLAIIGGKGQAFPWPSAGGPPNDFGTDGGAHNFLRYLESGATVNYRGAIATFYFNRQGVGTYKCCTTVYGAPIRNYNFDTDFLDPTKLPPLTPVFRDINALGFAQELRPGK